MDIRLLSNVINVSVTGLRFLGMGVSWLMGLTDEMRFDLTEGILDFSYAGAKASF